MGLHSGEADWVAGLSFANVSMHFVTFITLNTDTDTDTVAGFNHVKRITKASATDLHAIQDKYNKGI